MNCKIIIVSLCVFLTSCKKNNDQFHNTISKKQNFVNNVEITNKEYIEIVRQNNEFKLSCANVENYNHVKLSDKILHIELIEPIDYEINKIEKRNDSFIIHVKNEQFCYKVTNIDKKRGIFYWENIVNNKKDNDFSFYTIDNLYLKSANLKKEDCISSEQSISGWIGKYQFSMDMTRMDETHNINIIFDIKTLDNIKIISIIDKKDKKIDQAKAKEDNDELIINPVNSADEYIITKTADGFYKVSGQTISLLNPPNDEYDLEKIE